MAVPQHVLDLFNLSLPALRQLAAQAGKQVPAGATKAEVIAQLSDAPRDLLQTNAADLLYAGNTSITWLRFASGALAPDALRAGIASMEGADPFAKALRPSNVTYEPKIVEARGFGKDKVVLTFVVRKRVQTVIRNFELVPVYADDFFQVIARLDVGIFEVRASHDRATTFERTWLRSLAEVMGTKIDYALITYGDFDKLRTHLSAVLDAYKGKDSAGSIYDTIDLSRSENCADLAQEERFLEDIKDLVPVSADIMFTADGYNETVRLKVSSNGSVWFRTVVSEAVIDHVYRALRTIGAL